MLLCFHLILVRGLKGAEASNFTLEFIVPAVEVLWKSRGNSLSQSSSTRLFPMFEILNLDWHIIIRSNMLFTWMKLTINILGRLS
ncbi:hypothetical protein F5879DRAFT_599873 [Lentinula edodes]|nr:hypothetical protein F5879DRAFT_599873 [Lentinula edodes]